MSCSPSRILTSAIPVVLGFIAMPACENGPTEAPGTVPEAGIEREMVLTISPNLQELLAIDATGTSDVTDELNDYLAGLPDGSTVTFPAGAQYRAEGIVRLIDKTNLTIEGNGALIFARTDGSGVTPPAGLGSLWPRGRSHVEIEGGGGIVIRDLRIKGANPNAGAADGSYVAEFEGQHGFDVQGVGGLILERVTVTDTYGDLIYLGGRGGTLSENVIVTSSHFERSGRQGITMKGVRNVQILGSYLGEIGRSVIDFEPATLGGGGAQNVVIRGNTFGPCRHLLLTSGGIGPNVNDISFVENRLVGIGLKVRVFAQDGARRSNYKILNNVSDVPLGLSVAALRFGRVDGIEVRGNYQRLNPNRSMTAVTSCLSTGVSVRRNEFPGAVKHYDTIPDCTGMEK
jgi:hypothetical protein